MNRMHTPKSFFLSKSQFTRGLQCQKSLWLFKNRRNLQQKPDASLQARFDAGTEVGILAQQLFPGGTGLEYESGIAKNIQKTQELIASGTETVYEATFRHDNVLALPGYSETCLLEGANCLEVINARDFGHAYTSIAIFFKPVAEASSLATAR